MRGSCHLSVCALSLALFSSRGEAAGTSNYFKILGRWNERPIGTNSETTNTGSAIISASLPFSYNTANINPDSRLLIVLGSSMTGAGVTISHFLEDDPTFTAYTNRATFVDAVTNRDGDVGKAITTIDWNRSRLVISCHSDIDFFSAEDAYSQNGAGVTCDVFDTNLVAFPAQGPEMSSNNVVFDNYIFATANNRYFARPLGKYNRGAMTGAADFTPPTVKITSPVNGLITTSPSLVFFGTASDNVHNSQLPAGFTQSNSVLYSVDGTNFTGISGSPDGQPDYFNGTNWATPAINLHAGANRIFVEARDGSGNTSIVSTITVTFKPATAILIGVAPDIDGGLDGTVSSTLASGTSVIVGTRLTVRATPHPGFIFNGWTLADASGPLLSSQQNPLTLAATSNLTLLANFTYPTNFDAAQGSYSGLFFATYLDDVTGNSVTDAMNSGYLSLAVNSNGTYSGSLTMLAGRFPFTGRLAFISVNGSGAYYTHLEVPRGELPAVSVEFGIDGGAISNSAGDANAVPMVGLAALSGGITGTSSALSGTYNLAMLASGITSGDSYGWLTVEKDGHATLAMNLADYAFSNNEARVISGNLTANSSFPFFIPLYAGSKGVLMGELTVVTNQGFTNDVQVSSLVWIKLPGASKVYYPNGFNLGGFRTTNSLTLLGSYYPGANSLMMTNFTDTITIENFDLPGTSYSAAVAFSNGQASVLTNPPNMNSNHVTGHFTPKNGLISGTFNPDADDLSQTLPFNALLLRNGAISGWQAFGYFIGTNQTGTIQLDPEPR